MKTRIFMPLIVLASFATSVNASAKTGGTEITNGYFSTHDSDAYFTEILNDPKGPDDPNRLCICLDGIDDCIIAFSTNEELNQVFYHYAVEVTFSASGDKSGYIIRREAPDGAANFVLYLRNTGSVYGYHEDSSLHNVSVETAPEYDLSDGQWHTVRLEYDMNANLKIYRDGVLDETKPNSNGPAYGLYNKEPVMIGHNPYTGQPDIYLEICIDDIAIWAMENINIGWELEALWQFDGDYSDSSGNEHHGIGCNENSNPRSYYFNDPSITNDVYCTAPGNDINDGLTPATPKINMAVLSSYSLKPGDKVYVDTGTYNFGQAICLNGKCGTQANPIEFIGSIHPDGTIITRSDYNSPKDINCAFAVDNSQNIIIRNFIIKKGAAGIMVRNYSHHITIQNNTLVDGGGPQGDSCIVLSNGVNDCKIINNIISDRYYGVQVTYSAGGVPGIPSCRNIIQNNFIFSCTEGVFLSVSPETEVNNNLFFGCVYNVFRINYIDGHSPGTRVYNNIIYGNNFENQTALEQMDQGNVSINPLLTLDGHLRADSNCIDPNLSYSVIEPNIPWDYDGENRISDGDDDGNARIDIGPDEFIDSDQDHLPDWWENRYFRTTTAANPQEDTDCDGFTNIEEYELYSSNPNSMLYYVNNMYGNDSYDGLSPTPGGSGSGPKKTIQAAIDAAGHGDTIIVAPAVYHGAGNINLQLDYKPLIICSSGNSANTTIDCLDDSEPNSRFIELKPGERVSIIGFGLCFGKADMGGALKSIGAQVYIRDCSFILNRASKLGGALYTKSSLLTLEDCSILGLRDPNIPDIWSEYGALQIIGLVNLEECISHLNNIILDNTGTLETDSFSVMNCSDVIVRNNIRGLGDINVLDGKQLIVESNAQINLGGSEGCNPDGSTGGQITVNGLLLVKDRAQVINTNVDVKLLELEGDLDIQNNNIMLLEASAGYGGEFFVDDIATITCNTIVSEGDRYLDLDPDPNSDEHPNIANNEITVIIKEGQHSQQGTLLELRAADYDCEPNDVNPLGSSGVFQVSADSPGFTDDPSENWVLEKLILRKNAKLNLTNRQGFVYQDLTDPNIGDEETVYVKELILYPGAVLNTALQTLYYENLILTDDEGNEWLRNPPDPAGILDNGSKIIDVPLLGFSLAIIAMNDQTPSPHNEFDIRVRKRIIDPLDIQPPPPAEPNKIGFIGRIDDDPAIPKGADGVMDMRTQAVGKYSASSVAAKGAFARAGEENITITFEYLFITEPDNAELIVYLSDKPEIGENRVEVARIRPPRHKRPGSVGSGQFAFFSGTFLKGDLNFTRGTYVELELRGTDARCLIDNWDPKIYCGVCGDYNSSDEIDMNDYLYLLAEYGLSNPAGYSKGCLDLVQDNCVNINDIIAWDSDSKLNMCPITTSSQSINHKTLHVYDGDLLNELSEGLVILGNSSSPNMGKAKTCIYNVEENGVSQESRLFSKHGRLITDNNGNLYHISGDLGLIAIDTGPDPNDATLAEPNIISNTISIGMKNNYGIPLMDAAFDPSNQDIVYIVPALEGDLYKDPNWVAAKLHLKGKGQYDVVDVYGYNQSSISSSNTTPYIKSLNEPDIQRISEIEVDSFGNLFVLSATDINKNNWLLIYNHADPNSRLTISLNDIYSNISNPTAMVVSSYSNSNRLYMASTSSLSLDPNNLTIKVHQFSILYNGSDVADVNYIDSISINCPRPDICDINPNLCGLDPNYVSAITSMTENPSNGTLYVTGFTAPTFPSDDLLPPGLNRIFTNPILAVIPFNANPDDYIDIVNAVTITGSDLALPISIAWIGESNTNVCERADINTDGHVTLDDLLIFVNAWLSNPNCERWNNRCDIAIPTNEKIDFMDLSFLSTCWHAQEHVNVCQDADLNDSGEVNEDLLIMALQWLSTSGDPSADISPYNVINFRDLSILNRSWLKTGCTTE